MATYRIGIGSEFQLKNNAVGVGSETTGLGNLIIDGTLKSSGLSASGVSTFISYSGFTPDEIGGNVTLAGEHQTTSDIVVGVGQTFIVSAGATVTVGTVESVSIGTHFSLPCGYVEDRPECPVEGTVRFNKDLNTLEFYNGFEWRQFTVNGASGRAVFIGGGDGSGNLKTIDYFNMSSQGNAVAWGGETLATESRRAGCGSEIRGLTAGSDDSSNHEIIEYITIASQGNTIDFGDMYNGRGAAASFSSSTRGIWAGGRSPSTSQNTIDYVEIPTLGDAKDFGDLRSAKQWVTGCSSPTRGIIGGGEGPAYPSPSRTSDIEYVSIASKGNAVLFGQLTTVTGNPGGFSNSVRGFFAGGEPTTWKKIDVINIASTGNAVHFGDLRQGRIVVNGTASQTRGFIIGGRYEPSAVYVNAIEYVEIASSGNAVDWGDLTVARWSGASISDSHGGLGGY